MITEWIVAFEPRTSAWWGRFLRDGFGHCFAFGFCARSERWLVVEPTFERGVVAVAEVGQVEAWFAEADAGRLRLVAVECQDQAVRRPRFVVTCAGAVAGLLGLRRYPLTPWGLFRMVRAFGGKELGRG